MTDLQHPGATSATVDRPDPGADAATPPKAPRERRVRPDESPAGRYGPGFLVKLALMAVVDAFGAYVVWSAWVAESWVVLGAMVAMLAVANWVYFSRRTVPLKYVLPGLIFLFTFQIFTIAYTGWVAFTNYGDGHNSTKDDAISALLTQNERRVEGSPSLPLTVVTDGDALGFAVVRPDGTTAVGDADDALAPVEATVTEGRIAAVDGWEVLDRQEILERQGEVTNLRVPLSDDPNDGSVRTQDARTGYVFTPTLVYDEAADTMTDTTTGTVYTPNDEGQFEAADGSTLQVGWRVFVGFDNFTTAFSDSRYAGPFFQVVVWTFVFAFLSVATTFLLGMFLATVFNAPHLRGRKIYRTLLILPYAIPGFVAPLLWSGLLNRSFGFVNQVLLGGAAVPWLTDPWLAKFSIIAVNLWLGFPYMFLICTGALQSLPTDVLEAAKIDGAGRLRTWRSVTMPLLLVSTTPLLISSFAFNFNNFALIYMLTGGGPRFADASVPLGHTDILITMVYSVAGLDGSAPKNFGLASALSIVIFVIIATISAIAFKRTRSLEEIN
ncbi:carbohydrate ABC transporter membrane protein 1 (CUT1 family) [Isoptericola sp. CG 20/1183]|uniref:Maltose/maltodextrin transport system permease protein n=1 Tax=Isoptericola halotolerans TaxID=300560 RepID=A0ABX5EEI7_9MICO|nr:MULTISPECIES: ABC transporter permease subunit [Isoptericola]PRZ05041.1 carbohydrate ABC transporter membrane protein 1 (CUT1 family) [Isoptericola halotolerans]PRZ05780.1 carbohydrate ABC transporter membrane protein 1 (CUT1 family) [Isoptericola sp. CG 20/1183]